MALEKESETYRRELPNLLGQEGKFALVFEDELTVYDTYEDAIKSGYEKYALKPFMVKKIAAVEQVQFFTRDFSPCRT